METLSRGWKNNEQIPLWYWKKSRILVTMSPKVTWKIANVTNDIVELAKKIS